jgi:hypothetical protein
MSYRIPQSGKTYIRRDDLAHVEVVETIGTDWHATVVVSAPTARGRRTTRIPLDRFWKKHIDPTDRTLPY